AEALARHLRPFFPALLELVAGRLRKRIAHLPETADEGVALVVLAESQEGFALLGADQQGYFFEPLLVPRAQLRGGLRLCRRQGDGKDGDGSQEERAEEPNRHRSDP